MATQATEVLTRLQTEWDQLWATSRRGARALARWRSHPGGEALAGFATLDDLVAVVRRSDVEASDQVLRVLIRAAQAGDHPAARTTTQVLMPFITSYVRSFSRHTVRIDLDEAAAEVLAAVQTRIAAIDLDRHPTGIASHLVLTTRRSVSRPVTLRRLAQLPADGSIDWCTGEMHAAGDDSEEGTGLGVPTRFVIELCTHHQLAARTTADQIGTILSDAVHTGGIRHDDAELVVWVAAGHRIPTIAGMLGRDASVIRRRLYRATTALAQVAA